MQQRAAGGRCCICTHGRHVESITSYQKSHYVSQCVFGLPEVLKNNPTKLYTDIPIRFERTEP